MSELYQNTHQGGDTATSHDQPGWPSGRAMIEPAGPSGALGVARGWGSVSSDEVFEVAAAHEVEADRLQRVADYYDHTDRMRTHCAKKAAVERLCAEILLRHAASMTERQPSPNQVLSIPAQHESSLSHPKKP